jgi:geranylgeranyl reductase family protein
MRANFDVAVVGAGPSGAWTATLLAKRGVRVALIDASHPREKACGGGITGRALAIVADHVSLRDLPAVEITAARFVDAATGASAPVALGAGCGRAPLIVARRADFDRMLYEAAEYAGASLIRQRTVDITRDRSGFSLRTAAGMSCSANWIVGADGANSLVRRRLAVPFRRADISIATGFFAHGVTSSEIVIELIEDPPGYIWSFPRPDHLAIGMCAQADAKMTADALRARVAAWIRTSGIADGARLQAYSWPIPSLSARSLAALTVAGDGWLTVGDAAGLVDPITREGIYFALQSAALAADAIAWDSANASKRFAEQTRAAIIDELARAARFKAGFFRPRFTRLLIHGLRQSAGIRGVMADLVAGEQPYRDLKWRLIKTMELRVAWRLFTETDTHRAREHARSAC